MSDNSSTSSTPDPGEAMDTFFEDYERQMKDFFKASVDAVLAQQQQGSGAPDATGATPAKSSPSTDVNKALVFIKPHAAKSDKVQDLVKEKLAAAKVEICESGTITGKDIDEKGVIDTHYSTIHKWAIAASKEDIKAILLPESIRAEFKEKFGVAFSDAELITAVDARERIGTTSGAEVAEKWNGYTRMKLLPGVYVSHFEDKGYFVLNGFYLQNREKFTDEEALVRWFVVQWNEGDLKWKEFRGKVVGATDPTKSEAGSIRAALLADYESLGLSESPNTADNGIHASAGPLEAVKELRTWAPSAAASTPLELALQDFPDALRRMNTWLDNPAIAVEGTTAPVFDHFEDAQTSEVAAALKDFKRLSLAPSPPTKRQSNLAQVYVPEIPVLERKPSNRKNPAEEEDESPSRRRPNRWLMRTPTPPPEAPVDDVEDDDEVYEDHEFRANHEDSFSWKRVVDIYEPEEGEPLLPEDFSFDDAEQGLHPDTFFLTALSVISLTPQLVRNMFVTKTIRKSGKYAFQFYAWDKWTQVVIDDTVPVHQGSPIFCRSPNKRIWPLLLEKAYAAFYNSYDNTNGGNLAEALHDMTAKPVTNVIFDMKFNQGNVSNDNAHEVPFWVNLTEKLRTRSYGVSAGTLREFTETNSLGLETGQGYGIDSVIKIQKKNDELGLENFLIKLINPAKTAYTGPYNYDDQRWNDDLKQRAGYDPSSRNFFMTVPTFLKYFVGLQVCRVEAYETRLFFEGTWDAKEGTAGGNPTYTTWRMNPKYFIMNRHLDPANAIVMIKQPDQRRDFKPGGERALRYLQCGVTITQHQVDNHPTTTPLVTGSQHKHIYKSVFFNQREVSNFVTFPADTGVYLTPSTYHRSQEGRFMLIVYCETSRVSFHPLEVDVAPEPIQKTVRISESRKGRADVEVGLTTDMHILVRQDGRESIGSQKNLKAPQGDVLAQNYIAFSVFNGKGEKVGGLTKAMNYREVSAVLDEVPPGVYTIRVTCVQGTGSNIPATISVYTEKPARAKFVNEDASDSDTDGPLQRKSSNVPSRRGSNNSSPVPEEGQAKRTGSSRNLTANRQPSSNNLKGNGGSSNNLKANGGSSNNLKANGGSSNNLRAGSSGEPSRSNSKSPNERKSSATPPEPAATAKKSPQPPAKAPTKNPRDKAPAKAPAPKAKAAAKAPAKTPAKKSLGKK